MLTLGQFRSIPDVFHVILCEREHPHISTAMDRTGITLSKAQSDASRRNVRKDFAGKNDLHDLQLYGLGILPYTKNFRLAQIHVESVDKQCHMGKWGGTRRSQTMAIDEFVSSSEIT